MRNILIVVFALISLGASGQTRQIPTLKTDSLVLSGESVVLGGSAEGNIIGFDGTVYKPMSLPDQSEARIDTVISLVLRTDTIYSVINQTDTIYSITSRIDTMYSYFHYAEYFFSTLVTSDTVYSITARVDTLYINNTVFVNNVPIRERNYTAFSGTTPTAYGSNDGHITLTGNTVMTIQNVYNGDSGDIYVIQGSSDYSFGFAGTYKVINGGGGAISIQPGAGSVTVVSYKKLNNEIVVNYGKNYN